MLKIENISKRLGKEQILKNVSFEVSPGEVFGFLGPNGAGKTTTIRIITGLLEQDAGTVTVNGFDVVHERSKALTQIGAIVENPAFYPYMTGKQNLVQAKNLIPGLAQVDYEALAQLVGLEGKLSKKVGEYSLGMKQRLGIARALLHNPRVLILDEPTNGLDPAGIAELREYLRKMAREQNIAILISSHMLGEMEQISDRYAIIDQGVIKSVESVRNETGAKILIRVSETHVPDVIEALRVANYPAERWNDSIVITAPESDTPAIARLIVPMADLHELTVKRLTLEEQFLQVTKKAKIVLAVYVVIVVGFMIIAKTTDFDFTRSSYYTIVSTLLFGLLGIITIVFTAETVGNEVRYDTMKHLLMSPYSRMTIYFSKLLFSILIMLGQFIFIASITYAASFAFSEAGESLQLRDTILALINPIFTIFMTLFFSLVFRSVGMIIGFTVLAQFFTTIAGNLLLGFKPEIAKWIVLMHLDWSMYFKGTLTYGMAETMGTTLTFSVIFVLAHILVLFGGSILIFQKKSYL